MKRKNKWFKNELYIITKKIWLIMNIENEIELKNKEGKEEMKKREEDKEEYNYKEGKHPRRREEIKYKEEKEKKEPGWIIEEDEYKYKLRNLSPEDKVKELIESFSFLFSIGELNLEKNENSDDSSDSIWIKF